MKFNIIFVFVCALLLLTGQDFVVLLLCLIYQKQYKTFVQSAHDIFYPEICTISSRFCCIATGQIFALISSVQYNGISFNLHLLIKLSSFIDSYCYLCFVVHSKLIKSYLVSMMHFSNLYHQLLCVQPYNIGCPERKRRKACQITEKFS